ncbi:MAG TPA: hypothetical protein VFC19_28385 [Candidatus Limnocylindrales bacterium]|nr:hypothetical protein [Candidatus Limnocylindrales bacterium]
MHCECGGVSPLTAEDYHRTVPHLAYPERTLRRHYPLWTSGAAIRDPDDPALNTTRVNRLAWYYNSTSPDWPSTTYADAGEARLRAATEHLGGTPFQEVLDRQTGLALHVGTYEAAIENMLRRMRYQDGATEQFYLHRVALAVDLGRVEDGHRDENNEPAAQLSTTDLRTAGLDAVRYLNVYESVGSMLPRRPAPELVPAHGATLLSLLDHHQAQLDQLARSAADASCIPDTDSAHYRSAAHPIRPAPRRRVADDFQAAPRPDCGRPDPARKQSPHCTTRARRHNRKQEVITERGYLNLRLNHEDVAGNNAGAAAHHGYPLACAKISRRCGGASAAMRSLPRHSRPNGIDSIYLSSRAGKPPSSSSSTICNVARLGFWAKI